MRLLFFIIVLTSMAACSVKPEYLVQTPTALKVGLDRATDKIFSLVDKDNHVISKTKSTERTLIFALQPDTTPNDCYAIFDNKGHPLLEKTTGVKITAADDYHQQSMQLQQAERELAQCDAEKENASITLQQVDIQLKNNKFYDDGQCRIPVRPQADYGTESEPDVQTEQLSFSKAVCKDFSQCDKLDINPCSNQFANPKPCSTVEPEKQERRDISQRPSIVLPPIRKEENGIRDQVLESLAACQYQLTPEDLDAGNDEDFFFTILLKAGETNAQMKGCIEQFIEDAYVPIAKWRKIEKTTVPTPDRAQQQCQSLLDDHNATLQIVNANHFCIKESTYRAAVIRLSMKKLAQTKSEPQLCRF